MKSRILMMAVAGLMATSVCAAPNHPNAQKLNQLKAQLSQQAPAEPVDINDVSYSFGFMMGSNMKRQQMDLNTDKFITGMQDALAGKEGKFDRAEMMKLLMNYQRQVRAKMAEERKKLAETNQSKGQEFLTQNKAKPGVIALPSGLQYKIITPGNGAKPTDADKVKVTYTGTLISGDQFGASDDENSPATFSLNQVIPGWKEALPMMQAGATWELYIPPKLAYGERGTQGKIGPNETLIFRIKLLEVEKGAAKANTPQQTKLQNSSQNHRKNQRQG